jgi:glycosyltransferase involved in cell wall biosynthesis
MKVLLSAFSCIPSHGSEPGLGWGVALTVATRHQTWILTDQSCQQAIERELSDRSLPNARFIFLQPPMNWLGKQRSYWLHGLYYFVWQLQAFRTASRLHRTITFDLVHHVTYTCTWIPSFLGWLGPPFIWTAGALEKTPWLLFDDISWSGRLREALRNIAIPSVGLLARLCTAQKSRRILSPSARSLWRANLPVESFALGGLTPNEVELLSKIPPRNQPPFRVISIGRLLGVKGFALGIRAFARLQVALPGAEYWIIGDGPEYSQLRTLAQELGCGSAVRFFGRLLRDDVFRLLGESDVLLHPSFHEQFGYVVVEAMAASKPVICIDVAGSSHLVREDCGSAVPLAGREDMVNEIFRELLDLASDPKKRMETGRRARDYATREWNWIKVGQRLLALYDADASETYRGGAGHPPTACEGTTAC